MAENNRAKKMKVRNARNKARSKHVKQSHKRRLQKQKRSRHLRTFIRCSPGVKTSHLDPATTKRLFLFFFLPQQAGRLSRPACAKEKT